MEPVIKQQVTLAIENVYASLKGKGAAPNLESTLSNSVVNSQFVADLMAKIDLSQMLDPVVEQQMGNSMSWNVAMIMISTAILTIESPLSFTGTNYIQLPVIWMGVTNYDWDTIFMPNYFCITMFNSFQSTPLSFAPRTEQLTLLTVSFINCSFI
jgi:hypothetical protein